MTIKLRNSNVGAGITYAATQPDRRSGGEKATMQTQKHTVTEVKNMRSGRICAVALGTIAGLATLAGCGGSAGSALSSTGVGGAGSHGTISGSAYGGQQPVAGATIQLYTVGTTGLKSAATPLLPTSGPGVVTTDANGNFSLSPGNSPLYSCTNATQIYIVATGGTNGFGSTPNTALSMMAPLGSCSALYTSAQNGTAIFIQLNEVTTVAAVYALAPFMASYSRVGASGSNPTGLVNAVSNFNTLANITTGGAGGGSLPSGATVPAAEIDTLADIIAGCINSNGIASSACSTLQTATGASDTVGMLLAIAQNPSLSKYTALYSQATPQSPFQPTLNLSSAPNDWTISVNYTGGGSLSAPSGIAIDTAGNVWVTNASSNALVELPSNAATATTYTGGGMLGAKGLAIDKNNNVWVANPANSSVIKFTSASSYATATPYTGGSLSGPVSIAIDSANNAWVANVNGTSVTQITSGGTLTSFTGSGAINLPSGVAIDSTGHVWVANYGNSNVVELTNAGALVSGSPFSDVTLQGPSSIAVDASGDVWMPGATTGTAVAGAVSSFSNTGVASASSPYSGGGLLYTSAVATSGTTAWVVNEKSGSGLSQIVYGQSTPSSPTAGLGVLSSPTAVAVDPSGDVWTANSGDNSLTQFIGLTAPVTTPIAANVGP
jgi:streptogramin lyase